MAGVLHWVSRNEWAAMQNARRRRLMGSATPTPDPDADILALFSSSEQGAWYDPSDLTTMFQDAVGTIPVTGDNQPVGLILDKHSWGGKTLAQVIAGQPEKFGSQIPMINNTGGSDGVYTPATKTCANTATGTDSGYPRFTFDLGLTAGRYYSVTGKLTGDTSAVLLVQLATSGSASRPSYNPATGDIKGIVPASSQYFQLILNGTLGAKAASIASLSVKEVPGNHASQTTVASKPTYRTNGVLSWLAFDGVDDFLVTPSIDFSAKDEVTQMLGLSNTMFNSSLIMELSTASNTNNGSFGVYTDTTVRFGVSSRGTLISPLSVIRSTPFSGVATGLAKIGTDTNLLRHNGAQIGSQTADQGTGNYGIYPFYIGRRGGTTQAFSGNVHGLIVRGALTADPQLTQAERWMAKKTGVAI